MPRCPAPSPPWWSFLLHATDVTSASICGTHSTCKNLLSDTRDEDFISVLSEVPCDSLVHQLVALHVVYCIEVQLKLRIPMEKIRVYSKNF